MMWTWSSDELRQLGQFLSDRGLCGATVTAKRIGDGHSNLTYLVSDGDTQVVVRRPPPPPLPPGANDVLREARLLSALADTDVPAPRVLATAATGELLDVPVIVMNFVEGVVITESTPARAGDTTLRRRIAESLVDSLAAVHAVAWRDVGLADFSKPEGFNDRQLRRMRSLIDIDAEIPKPFIPLHDWLRAHLPTESAISIVHNDFRIGNTIVDTGTGQVAAVLDWELATIGDPLADVGYLLACYPAPGQPLVPTAAMGTAVLEPGYPDRAELLDRYRDRTGADVSGVNWYEALAMYKLAALYEYSRRRFEAGVGDAYYADPQLVASFLAAGERLADASRSRRSEHRAR
jgi:aminoglycoside phosphotransferase (APT) family kinase protein